MKHVGQKGFTLVEMLVVAPIVILAIGAFLTVIISMTGEVISSRASNTLIFNVQDALARIEEDVELSAGFLATNTVTLSAAQGQGYNNDATNFTNVGSNGNALILNMIATDTNPLTSTSQYVYLRDQPNSCLAPQNNIPLTYNVVYFVKDGTLWRRTIMPQQYADTTTYACGTTWQQPSCNPTWLASQGGTPFCRTEDIRLVDGVAADALNIEYYAGATTTPITTATNTGSTIPERNNAMVAATTVNVTLNANQTAAGRAISQTSSVRATRLAINASAIASLTPPAIPTAPQVTATTAPGARATFSWPAVTGATGYTLEYRINNGTWQTGFTNQNTRTFTATAPYSESSVDVRVLAQNATGQSALTSSVVVIPRWEPLILSGGWRTYDTNYSTPAYTKTAAGIVVVKGMISRSPVNTNIASESVAVLPEGFRPQGGRLIFGTTRNPNVHGRVDVEANGTIIVNIGNSSWTSLETIRFAAAGEYTFTTPTLLNGYAQYGGIWAPVQYTRDSQNRVHTQGLATLGTATNGTRIFDMPATNYPPQYMHMSTYSNGYGYVGADYRSTASTIVAKPGANSYIAINTMYYPTGTTGWSNITLQNGWARYGTDTDVPVFTTAQYKKGQDNIVSLKGLIRSGTTTAGTTIFNLPAGFRPAQRILYTTVSADAHARIDFLPNGNVEFYTGSNIWFSLDGISFVAEQ